MFEYNDNLNMITENGIKFFVLREERESLFLTGNQEHFIKEPSIKLCLERECVVFSGGRGGCKM